MIMKGVIIFCFYMEYTDILGTGWHNKSHSWRFGAEKRATTVGLASTCKVDSQCQCCFRTRECKEKSPFHYIYKGRGISGAVDQ